MRHREWEQHLLDNTGDCIVCHAIASGISASVVAGVLKEEGIENWARRNIQRHTEHIVTPAAAGRKKAREMLLSGLYSCYRISHETGVSKDTLQQWKAKMKTQEVTV